MAVSNKPKQNLRHPNIKIPPPLLALIFLVLVYVLTWLIPLPLVVPSVLQVMGFLLVILGFLVGIAALITFHRARTTANPRGRVTLLVTTGITVPFLRKSDCHLMDIL